MDTPLATVTSPASAAVRHTHILKQLERKLLWLSSWMIHNANHIRPNRDGLKVGGHQASCASMHLDPDGAVFRDRPPAGPHRGQAARRPGVPRDQLPARPADAGEDGGPAPVRRHPALSQPGEGRRRGRFLHRLRRPRRGDDDVLRADGRLCPAARSRPPRPAARPPHRHRRRRRTRRGQHLRGPAGRLEARRPRPLVGHRLQPPKPRQRRARPPVRPHRGPVPRHGLELSSPSNSAARSKPRSPARAARTLRALDRRLPEQPLFRADLPGRRRVAPGAAGRSRPLERARHHRSADRTTNSAR